MELIEISFQTECGLQYTRKMEGMFRDIFNSSELTAEFQNHVTDTWVTCPFS